MIREITRWAVRLAAAFGVFFSAITFLPVLEPWNAALTSNWQDHPSGTLVVLGAEGTEGQILGLHSYWRAVYAVYEWRSGRYQAMLLSGGGGLAEAMRDFVVAQGVPTTAVTLETRSRNTHEQAVFVTEILRKRPAGSCVLLTSDFHSRRALAAFRKAGPGWAARPFPDAAKRMPGRAERWGVFLDLAWETAKLAGYRWRGWI
jgi:uncharacterized SAM-binding protein YcdF (DUF218 family)